MAELEILPDTQNADVLIRDDEKIKKGLYITQSPVESNRSCFVYQQVLNTDEYLKYHIITDKLDFSKTTVKKVSLENSDYYIASISFVGVADNFNKIEPIENYSFCNAGRTYDKKDIVKYFLENPFNTWNKFFKAVH